MEARHSFVIRTLRLEQTRADQSRPRYQHKKTLSSASSGHNTKYLNDFKIDRPGMIHDLGLPFSDATKISEEKVFIRVMERVVR